MLPLFFLKSVCLPENIRQAVVFVTNNQSKDAPTTGYCLTCAKELGIKPVEDLISKMGISDDDLEAVQDQMNTLMQNMGEGGDMLSTGEKQLISFARAILADPRILVLDEATASIDTITEQKIQNAIDTIIRGRTSIVIAHRLSTVRNADIILVVKDGRIIEQGRHDELLAAHGHYYRLYTRQYEDEATSAFLSRK